MLQILISTGEPPVSHIFKHGVTNYCYCSCTIPQKRPEMQQMVIIMHIFHDIEQFVI